MDKWTTIRIKKEKSNRIDMLTTKDRKKEYVADEILELGLMIKEQSERAKKPNIQLDY